MQVRCCNIQLTCRLPDREIVLLNYETKVTNVLRAEHVLRADHVLRDEHNIWRALIVYVAAGAIQEALMALRNAQQPDTAPMFILACCEIQEEFNLNLETSSDEVGSSSKDVLINLPGLNPENEDVIAVGEYYGQYQRKLVHLCMDSRPFSVDV